MSKSRKFDEHDRKAVVAELNSMWGISLKVVKGYRKYFADEHGKKYLIVGGYEDWHGVPDAIIVEARAPNYLGSLVVVRRIACAMELYEGDLRNLALRQRDLQAMVGQYTFHVTKRGDELYVDEAPSVRLEKIGEMSFGAMDKAKSIISSLSPQERADALKKLSDK